MNFLIVLFVITFNSFQIDGLLCPFSSKLIKKNGLDCKHVRMVYYCFAYETDSQTQELENDLFPSLSVKKN